MNNRRNYYRILHVQPEAPIEIIKASYRSLMTKLNAHPDRGGNHEYAVLINQAYSVLSDPQRRKKYDEMLMLNLSSAKRTSKEEAFSQQSQTSASTQNNAFRSAKENVRTASPNERRHCLFCGTAHPAYVNKYCTHCQSPLAPIKPAQVNRRLEVFGRRAVPRIPKTGPLTLYPSWPHAGFAGQLRDLSISGLCVLTAFPAKTGQIVKFDSNFLKCVARVVTVRGSDVNFSVHVTFLTAEFITKSGVFFTEKA